MSDDVPLRPELEGVLPSPEQFAQVMRPGPYLCQYVPRGPWMPARLLIDDAGCWVVEIGAERFQGHPDPMHAHRAMWLFRWGRPCSELDYALAAAKVEYARQHDPDSPYAHPDRPYDPRVADPIF